MSPMRVTQHTWNHNVTQSKIVLNEISFFLRMVCIHLVHVWNQGNAVHEISDIKIFLLHLHGILPLQCGQKIGGGACLKYKCVINSFCMSDWLVFITQNMWTCICLWKGTVLLDCPLWCMSVYSHNLVLRYFVKAYNSCECFMCTCTLYSTCIYID